MTRTTEELVGSSSHACVFDGGSVLNSQCWDLDVNATVSRGQSVVFKVVERNVSSVLRCRVSTIALACGGGGSPFDPPVLASGGRRVEVSVDRLVGADEWEETGMVLHYLHLDPVYVSAGDEIVDQTELGELGPETPWDWDTYGDPVGGPPHPHAPGSEFRNEYHTSCAVHSHVHVEAEGARFTHGAGSLSADAELLAIPISGG